jgi:hypothetical protein
MVVQQGDVKRKEKVMKEREEECQSNHINGQCAK